MVFYGFVCIAQDQIALFTEFYTGADLAGLCRRATKIAIAQNISIASSGRADSEIPVSKLTKEHFARALVEVRERRSINNAGVNACSYLADVSLCCC